MSPLHRCQRGHRLTLLAALAVIGCNAAVSLPPAADEASLEATQPKQNGEGNPAAARQAYDNVVFVDDDAPAGGDGTTWATAFRHLQDALASAQPGDELRVAGGRYTPDLDEDGNVTAGDRSATFQLLDDVAVRGGYAGLADPAQPDARDPATYQTVLSGDLLGDDDPSGSNVADNSFHVVTGSGTTETALLDGVTLSAGNANGPVQNNRGGGVYNDRGSPTLVRCTLAYNSAAVYGGGMYNKTSSHPRLIQCTFRGNASGAWGGGMYNVSGSSPMLSHCDFGGNWAGDDGGGMYNLSNSHPMLNHCTLSGNAAGDNGGAMFLQTSSPTLAHCTFSRNEADDDGGGIYAISGSNPLIRNSILWGNSDDGGTDESAQLHVVSGAPVVNYSCVQGGWSGSGGEGNVASDPGFADPDGPDGLPGTEDDDLRLLPGSPCIDAASNGAVPSDDADLDGDGDTLERTPLDLDGAPRFVDDPATDDTGVPDPPMYPDVADMGAYELGGDVQDCNGNGISDDLDLTGGTSLDCNSNGLPDECDVAAGTSEDCNEDGAPDECSDDSDQDGLVDPCDACPDSDLSGTIVIDGCDSGVANDMFLDGCTMADQISECAATARNHGGFVSCVAHLTQGWRRAGLIGEQQHGRIRRCAAKADLP